MIIPVTTLNLAFEQGTPFDYVYTWTDSNNVPRNLTGYTAHLRVVTDLVYQVPLVLFTTGVGATAGTSLTLGGVAGTVEFSATDVATAAMTFVTGVYALVVRSSTGVDTKLLEGAVVVYPGLSY